MIFKKIFYISIFLLVGCSSKQESESPDFSRLVEKNRLVMVKLDNGVKFKTLDTYAKSLKNALSEIATRGFSIYSVCCYSPRSIVNNSKKVSLHAYAAAIDINPCQNPFYDVSKKLMIPLKKEIAKEEEQKDEKFRDFYLNRNIVRKGMLTPKEAKVFARHGFTIWGGYWRRPIDYMHIEIPIGVAQAVAALSASDAKIFWNEYIKISKKISKDQFFNQKIDKSLINLPFLLSKIQKIVKSK